MKSNIRLAVETLEERVVPAIFGIPWVYGQSITMSFAPDKTQVDSAQSTLFSYLESSGMTDAQWQGEILRAAQTWAQAGNINIGLVKDSGAPIGSFGFQQGDSHFGDIRVYARSLGAGTLAITTPPGDIAGTRNGDIILNTDYKFSVGGSKAGSYDLYTTMLHEIGHALGIADINDPTSAMYGTYHGTRTGLGNADVTAVQALYGARQVDVFENGSGNDVQNNAAELTAVDDTTSTLYARADLTTSTDVDWYRITTPSAVPYGLKVYLRTAGLSLLSGKVSIRDSSGNVLASAAATGPGKDVSLSLASAAASATYYLVVEKNGSTGFAVGGYKLSAVFDPGATDPATVTTSPTYAQFSDENDGPGDATALQPVAGTTSLVHYETTGMLANGGLDYYLVTAPNLSKGQSATLIVNLQARSPGQVASAAVFDTKGNQLPAVAIYYDGFNLSLQLTGVTSGKPLLVQIGNQNNGQVAVDYSLWADFIAGSLSYTPLHSGQLTASGSAVSGVLTVNESQALVMQLAVSTTGPNSPGVTINVYDSTGVQVGSYYVLAGTNGFFTLTLPPGQYTVRLSSTFTSGQSPMNYAFSALTTTDPIGIPLVGGTTGTSSSGSSSTATGSSGTTPSSTAAAGVGVAFMFVIQ